ncbi:hypothetical protein [Kitasatospora sp. NPDC097643]|uniref:hypothetical protein n=1 Tax=Kitasatospora sp. NPDC097643 TaxID=3157230 RepID=UPI0033288261
MTAETDQPVYLRAAHAPWREILRHRWSGRRDRALVLRDRDGLYHLLGDRAHHGTSGEEFGPEAGRPRVARLGLRGFDRAYLVELDERQGSRGVGLPTSYGMESMELHVLWWVHDAAQVVRTRTVRGWLAVRKDLDQRLRHLKEQCAAAGVGLGANELMQYLAAPHLMPNCGLGYRVADVSARENGGELRLGEPDGADLPYAWSERSQDEYAFCRRAVQDGPVALAALWLARHPDEVRQVLDWSVDHAELLRGETTWQDQMAVLLGRLTGQEQQELSHVLRERLVALGRRVPGPGTGAAPQGPGTDLGKTRARANGWHNGVANGRPA